MQFPQATHLFGLILMFSLPPSTATLPHRRCSIIVYNDTSPLASVWFSCLAFFGLELTVGVSWAVPLDIGSDYAGSVSSVMNTCGNVGGAISPAILGYIVQHVGWEEPFLVASAMCVVGAILYLRIDASRRVVFVESK